MKKQLIYDLPVRLFHWFFAFIFIGTFLIAKTVDDESATFTYHMLAGFMLVFIVLLRIIWGFVGSKYSRFSSFVLHPRELVSYFSTMLSGEKRKWAGHNPASSWASLTMFGLTLALGVTGYLMVNGYKEELEDIHELLANSFLVIVLMHVAGVIFHSLRHRDGIAISMITGEKVEVSQSESISHSRVIVAGLFVGLISIFTVYIARHFDRQKQELIFFGSTLQLKENEGDDDGQDKTIESDEKHEKYKGDDD